MQMQELALDNVPANGSFAHVAESESRKQSGVALSESGIQIQRSRSTQRGIQLPEDQPEMDAELQAVRSEIQDEIRNQMKLDSTPIDKTAGPSLPMQSPFQNVPLNRPPRLVDLQKWDTLKLLEVGSHVTRKYDARSAKDVSRCEIHVEEPAKVSTMRRGPRKAMSGPDIASIVNKFIRKDEDGVSVLFFTWSLQKLWNALKEEPGKFRYAVWIKTSFLTSVIILIYICIRSISLLANVSVLYKENRDRFTSNLEELDSFLTNAGWTDGIDSVIRTATVQLYLLADAVILDLRHTAIVGYLLGLVVGLCSLVAVLIQHKRISLAVSEGLHTFRIKALSQNQQVESPWPAFQEKYPLLGSCFFLAILSSTAIVQLHIVGFIVAVLLGMVIHVAKLSVLMDLFGFYIMAYVLVFVVDVLVMHFSRTWLISPDGRHIKHPRWFNFIIVVLSMVHLVIGLLYALWRVVYLLITTIIVLNRLDISLFTAGKSLDNGHNAFMSMLVLTVLIQEDHESFTARTNADQTEASSTAYPVDNRQNST